MFPFAEALRKSIRDFSPSSTLLSSLAEIPLPFSDEAGEGDPQPFPLVTPAPLIPRFKITLNRICEHCETPGCSGCATSGTEYPKPHTAECRARFANLLDKAVPVARAIEITEGPRMVEDEDLVAELFAPSDEGGVDACVPLHTPDGEIGDASPISC